MKARQSRKSKRVSTSQPLKNVADGSAQPALLGEPLTLTDPVILHSCLQAASFSLNAYLIALAAFSRGLKVTFYYETPHLPILDKSVRFAGGLFSISDGRHCHWFQNTMGSLTPPAVAQTLRDKFATKKTLMQAGVPCPQGIVFDASQSGLAEKFTQRPGLSRFVVKPVDGSLSQGVHTNLDANEALACIASHQSPRLMLEEYIPGPEYRVAVVAGRCISVFEKVAPHVVGDGASTIGQLVEAKQASRLGNPHLMKKPLVLDAGAEAVLLEQALTPDSVPASGATVWLNRMASVVRGGDLRDVTAEFSPAHQATAVAACKALKVPNCGLDAIVDERSGQLVLLEANARAHISGHAFPSLGGNWTNRVAEAIVDHYFPDTVSWPRQIRAAFDFKRIAETLQDGVAREIGLPVLERGWVQRRLAISTRKPERLQKIQVLMREQGLYGFSVNTRDGVIIDLLGPPARVDSMIAALKEEAEATNPSP